MNTGTTIDSMTNNIVEQIKDKCGNIGGLNRIEILKMEIIDTNIFWIQLLLYDNDVLPLKVDILKHIYIQPIKNIYSSPGSALNTESNFITPKNKNLSTFLVNKGYLFIGITPREDAIPPTFDFGLIRDWGLEKHTEDFRKIVTLFQCIDNRDYDVLGHSAGALAVLNCSSKSRDNKLKAVRVIDIVGQYPPDSQEFINSQISLNAVNEIMSRGIFADTEFAGFKYIVEQASINPTGDSGVPRPMGGNFTNEGLVYFALIYTNQLPGLLTEITGLPSNWNFKQGFLSGSYTFGTLPTDDIYSLNHTSIETVYSAIANISSGIYPVAYERDFYAVWSNSYPLNWNSIKVPVFYINTELGFGDVSHTIGLLKNVAMYDVVIDYGHADPVYSNTANIDFWNKLVP
jgi:pimeloyl-ACP methyl ester carboxylesterase